jgi:hypothetical protein
MKIQFHKKVLLAVGGVYAVAATGLASFGAYGTSVAAAAAEPTWSAAQAGNDRDDEGGAGSANVVRLHLTPSSDKLASCMPNADLNVAVRLTTEQDGFDRFRITARHLPPNTDFTVFLLEQAGAPFGAAEYIGDLHTDANGNGENTYRLIVEEAFASTLVNGQRVRVDLNRVGMWFADPAADDFCLGPGSPVTPFDGDNEAGVQVFNSANTRPLPAP